MHPGFSVLPVSLSLAGIVLAFVFYKSVSNYPDRISSALGSVFRTIRSKFYIDEIYLFITKKNHL